ncbi:sigma-54 interaction domain-containing protein [Bacillus sp. OTU2372]|uniref:sigma-54 interaction domain-containing protein n=1 Tax=Bacillus sp. OTU2372 TaxID=3043858 RepID=UPI00313E6EC4
MFDSQDVAEKLPFGFLVVNSKGYITFANEICEGFLDLHKSKNIQDLLPGSTIIKVIKEGNFEVTNYYLNERTLLMSFPIVKQDLGAILIFQEEIFQGFVNHLPKVIELKQELEAIMNLSGELVTITDANGIVLRVNNTCEHFFGVREVDLVGKSTNSLEKAGVINVSSTQQVLEKKRKITMHQTTKSGRRLMVEGHPIFHDDGTLNKIINISKDVTEISNLHEKLEETRILLDYYQNELSHLQKQNKEMVVKSRAMEKVYELVCRVANVDATIYLHGETGVGKEVLARTIHQLSNRKKAPFIKVNCGAIPESIMESELFGYTKGAFTGANKEGKKGLALAADKGTLFLDEIGELPFSLQAKLLQLLQEKQFTPLGGTEPVQVDVRFIAATNRNLEEMVKKGSFREDLYYRLVVIPINIPSLSDRKEDIPFLINHFKEMFNQKYRLNKSFDPEVIQSFIDFEWKGNVRELQNTVERLIVTAPDQCIEMKHLPEQFLPSYASKTRKIGNGLNLKEEMERYEKLILLQVLETSSTMKEASVKLGVDASTITRKVRKYNINVAKLQFQL